MRGVITCTIAPPTTRPQEALDGVFPSTSYCYDIDKTWTDNIKQLPERCRSLPPAIREWAPEDKWVHFCGHKLASPLGVAAGPLLSSEWVALAAARGYDCLTYKTIRSHAHAGHGLPNVMFLAVQPDQQLQAAGPSCQQPLTTRAPYPPGVPLPGPEAAAAAAAATAKAAAALTASPSTSTSAATLSACSPPSPLAITNSFGMPSQGPEQLAADIPAAAAALRPGQMMVVSVTGTPGRPGLSFTDDLVAAAAVAVDAGATCLEVNLSCPNVGRSHVALYADAPAVEDTVRQLRAALAERQQQRQRASVDGGGGGGAADGDGVPPIALKVGAYADADSLRRVAQSAAAAGAAALSGINGLSRRVELPAALGGGPALGGDRPTSGVCGDPIRAAGLEFVATARQVIAADSLPLQIIGVGGVTRAEHALDYLRAGADVVQAATGFMWCPDLGLDFQRLWRQAGYCLPPAGDGRGGRQ
ncbi:hypothetical protein HYH02_007345 [Chlamydomonas schloesseri]|uniref:Dihydroorotate dehydrogenase catalytic domain-containing protein n=1 Tax=Chlamydomonas schloesseri TaxID=2026947 RepID=A0A836B515_9CHLO|nr:hypothetical protein HYH02_007345 [Chlamydomonas schloesseri]|eukprot:KAG2447891.1 hypothetical protein HYH02_007345 [Chlamydomonas schloesseri]